MGFHDFKLRMGIIEENDVYQYEEVTLKFRNQCFHLVSNLLDELGGHVQYWVGIEKKILIEFGKHSLSGTSPNGRIYRELTECNDVEALYIIEISLEKLYNTGIKLKDSPRPSGMRAFGNPDPLVQSKSIDNTIREINKKMLESSLGYESVEGQLLKIDNRFMHSEVIRKSIKLLHENDFQSASEEYLKAHSNYKNGDLAEAITNAGKAFESTMKIICHRLGYTYNQKDTANTLMNKLYENEFIPSSLKAHFGGVRSALESGLPKLRNEHSHGKGMLLEDVTRVAVEYSLNLCATNIVFLVETYKLHEVATDEQGK